MAVWSLAWIHFLDLKIFKDDNGDLHTSTFRKPTDRNTTLRADSFNPPIFPLVSFGDLNVFVNQKIILKDMLQIWARDLIKEDVSIRTRSTAYKLENNYWSKSRDNNNNNTAQIRWTLWHNLVVKQRESNKPGKETGTYWKVTVPSEKLCTTPRPSASEEPPPRMRH